MLIFTLAAAMTVAMLIATAIGLHEEAGRVKLENRVRSSANRQSSRAKSDDGTSPLQQPA